MLGEKGNCTDQQNEDGAGEQVAKNVVEGDFFEDGIHSVLLCIYAKFFSPYLS